MEGRQKRAELRQEMQEICRDQDHLYVSKIGILSASRFCGPFEPMPHEILSNVVILGGWKVESVPFNAILQAHGFTDNPYEAIAGNTEKAEKVFLLDEEIETTLAFLRDYYNPDAVAIEAGEWDGKTLWQVVTEKTKETGP